MKKYLLISSFLVIGIVSFPAATLAQDTKLQVKKSIAQKMDLSVRVISPDTSRRIGRKVIIRSYVKNTGNLSVDYNRDSRKAVLKVTCSGGKKWDYAKWKLINPGEEKMHETIHRWHERGDYICTSEVNWTGPNEENLTNNKASIAIHIKL